MTAERTAPPTSKSPLAKITSGAGWYLAVVVAVPALSLAAIGLYAAWQSGWLAILVAVWLGITALSWLAFIAWPRRQLLASRQAPDSADHDSLPSNLPPKPYWTEKDCRVYAQICARLDIESTEPLSLHGLRERCLDIASGVAAEYKNTRQNTALAFSLPEGLLLLSVVSARYRGLLVAHVPFIDRVQIAQVLGIVEHRERIVRGATWANRLRRGLRVVNPVSALLSEIREQFTAHVLKQINGELRRDLVQLLLQEVARSSVDLYAGHMSASEQELYDEREQSSWEATLIEAKPLEPLRIALIGQTGAGKSSLANALAGSVVAEVDVLQSTTAVTRHAIDSDAQAEHHYIVDTPGLDRSDSHRQLALAAMAEADVILWLSKATQPARAADAELLGLWQQQLAKTPQALPAPILLVISHIDQLAPRREWQPPYELDSRPLSTKASHILDASIAARDGIGLDPDIPCIPVRLDTGHLYNLQAVREAILSVDEAAAHTQLNRHRREHSTRSGTWRTRLAQTGKLTVGLASWLHDRTRQRIEGSFRSRE